MTLDAADLALVSYLLFVLGVALLFVGMMLGAWILTRSLLVGADSRDRTPHKLGSGFYYLVPESEYCELKLLEHRVKSCCRQDVDEAFEEYDGPLF